MSLAPNGILSGTPTSPGVENVTIQVADIAATRSRVFQFRVLSTGNTVADNDLILHYTFDEGSGSEVADTSPSGNDHTTTADITNQGWFAQGRFGSAYGATTGDGNFPAFLPANQQDLNLDPRADAYTFSCLLYTSPSPRDQRGSRMPSSA